MPTQRVYATLVLCTYVLFSCNHKKVSSNATAPVTTITDTVQLQQQENIDLAGYTTSFTQRQVQKFTAAPQKISVITAKKGLKITVDPSTLQKEDGSAVNEKIEVSVVELTNSEELFKSNAATVSNGRLLSSGGSYYIGMESGGQQLHVKAGNSLQVSFPKIDNNEMELFYGNRDNTGSMNWVKADEPLIFRSSVDYSDYNPPYRDTAQPYKSKYHLYGALTDKVLFADKQVTLEEMVKTLQKKGVDKNIDSFYLSWDDYRKTSVRRDTCIYGCGGSAYLYWRKVYRVISCKELEAEQDSLAKQNKISQAHHLANKTYTEEWERAKEEQSLTGQLQKYYAPAAVTKLGWINCDRFYNSPENIDIPLDLPITFSRSVIQYFIIYKSFNGLMNGQLISSNSNQQYLLAGLPVGQAVTLIAFTKSNGRVFQCKEEFVIEKNKTVKLDFKHISAAEMSTIFGNNVKI